MVPKPHDRIALRFKISGTDIVFINLDRVLTTVYFNHKLLINTGKVTYIGANRMLSPELATGNRSIAQ